MHAPNHHPHGGTLPANNPHYERIGGAPAIARLVERFYHYMDTLPEATVIRAMHPEDLGETKEILNMFLSGWLGGPQHYAERRGPPRLRMVHQPFLIDHAAKEAWMKCMESALADEVPDAELRQQLTASFRKVAESVKNR